MPRNSFFNDNLLSEIGGRLKFGGRNLEELLADIPMPESTPWSWPEHPHDKDGAIYGVRGFEYQLLLNQGLNLARHDPVIREAFKRFLQVTKLRSEDALQKATEREIEQAKQKQARIDRLDHKLRMRDQKVDNITKSWSAVRATIQTRWRKIIKSLAALLEQDAFLKSMDGRDQALIGMLERKGVLVVEDDRVKSVAWTKLEDFSIDDIQEVVLFLNEHETGGFIRPNKSEAEAA